MSNVQTLLHLNILPLYSLYNTIILQVYNKNIVFFNVFFSLLSHSTTISCRKLMACKCKHSPEKEEGSVLVFQPQDLQVICTLPLCTAPTLHVLHDNNIVMIAFLLENNIKIFIKHHLTVCTRQAATTTGKLSQCRSCYSCYMLAPKKSGGKPP